MAGRGRGREMTMPAWMTKEGVAAPPPPVAPPTIGGLNGERAARRHALGCCGGEIFMRRGILDLVVPLSHRVVLAAGPRPTAVTSRSMLLFPEPWILVIQSVWYEFWCIYLRAVSSAVFFLCALRCLAFRAPTPNRLSSAGAGVVFKRCRPHIRRSVSYTHLTLPTICSV